MDKDPETGRFLKGNQISEKTKATRKPGPPKPSTYKLSKRADTELRHGAEGAIYLAHRIIRHEARRLDYYEALEQQDPDTYHQSKERYAPDAVAYKALELLMKKKIPDVSRTDHVLTMDNETQKSLEALAARTHEWMERQQIEDQSKIIDAEIIIDKEEEDD